MVCQVCRLVVLFECACAYHGEPAIVCNYCTLSHTGGQSHSSTADDKFLSTAYQWLVSFYPVVCVIVIADVLPVPQNVSKKETEINLIQDMQGECFIN